MEDATPLNSSDATATDRRIMELLMVVMMTHYSLLLEEGAADDDAREIVIGQERQMTEILREGMTINTRAVYMELLMVTQRLLDKQLRSMDGGEQGRVVVSSSASDDHQLMDGAAAAKKKKAAAAAKKKRNKRNKAAAKRKGTKIRSWLGGGIISLLMMAALVVSFLLIHQSDGSSGGEAPPTLPPFTSTSLHQRDLLSSISSTTGMIPMAADVQSPVFSPAPASPRVSVNNRRMKSDERALSTCFDTPNWKDKYGYGCVWYEQWEDPGCPQYGSLHAANDNCCYCGGGSRTLPPTPLPTLSFQAPPSTTPPPLPPPLLTPLPTEEASAAPSGPPPTSSASPTLLLVTPTTSPPITGLPTLTLHRPTSITGHPSLITGHPALPFPTYSPTVIVLKPTSITAHPTLPFYSPTSPSSSPAICTDMPGWYDKGGYDCSWYEVMDDPGCPQYGSWYDGGMGVANDNCCYCKNDVASTVSPTNAPSSSGTCVDTPGWKDIYGNGCDGFYRARDDPECPDTGNNYTGEMGPAADNCCYCKDPTCEDFRSRCRAYTASNYWTTYQDRIARVCDKAASSCCDTAAHVKIVHNLYESSSETVGLYNECKCDFWLRLCQTRGGYDCDYAAEYCCGDYRYGEDDENFWYLNSPLCYCDFFNYAKNEFGQMLKPKALNISEEFSNPCGQLEDRLESFGQSEMRRRSNRRKPFYEKESLKAIYNATNGHNWTINNGWMNETLGHCQWYGISCDDEEHVTGIDLSDNNLEGRFPAYARSVTASSIYVNDWEWNKYGLANLYKLKNLDLSNNKLTGTIEYGPLYNLNALTRFDVSRNQLSGEVEALVAPSVTYADFSHNSFTRMRRFQKYKGSFQTLRYCDLSNNAIQEDATDLLENMPPNIEHFISSNSSIYGSLPVSLNYLPKLREFNMTSNALSGELPAFTESFATLQELDLSNQARGFTGSIPENVWRSLSLKILNLAGNKLAGSIPSLVGNLAVLEVFDLSNNRLESSIPPELGKLEGSFKRLDLSINTLSGTIPSQLGQLQGASVFLKCNLFHNISTAHTNLFSQLGQLQGASIQLKYDRFHNNPMAPLSLCLEREVEEFDLADNTTLCSPERNALSDFYDFANGREWTNGSLWLDEYASYCDWKGVTCDNMNRVTKLQLSNNGLSGRLSESIGNLTSIEELDLSDNDIKGSIPTQIGLLSNLTYLRLSYNAFTGTVPEGLGKMKGLQLLQLQSNRITEMPNIPRLDNSIHGQSTFVTDCGVPSAFDEALECENCTMCCNANDDCYPQAETKVAKWGMKDYGTFAVVYFACFFAICCIVFLFSYLVGKLKNSGNTSTTATETRSEEDDKYALSKIGKNSVYSYFVTDNVLGWLAALVTLGVQIVILIFFINASEANLQDDKIDIQFTWKCPRDTDTCANKADLDKYGWAIFGVLMAASLAKDLIGGYKLIHHSANIRHTLCARIRYFFGGMCLCSITLFALYVSTIYNKALATSNTGIIVNSVIILFVMDLDEWIFSALTAWNEKWTVHAEDGTIDELKEELRKLREIVQKLQESQAAAATTSDLSHAEQNIQEPQADPTADEMRGEIKRNKEQIDNKQKEIGNEIGQVKKKEIKCYKEQRDRKRNRRVEGA